MKVVINSCFGGFGLSHEAVMEWARRKGFPLYAFIEFESHFVPYKPGDRVMLIHYSKSALTKEGKYRKEDYFLESGIERTDPDLVAVVEELGDSANGDCANLEIVEIPDGVEWTIEEYDGYESIHEKHRRWP